MRELSKYYKLPFTTLNIKYGDEKIVFSLMRELRINHDRINYELMRQPSKYGFCLLLHKKLLTEFEKLKVEKNRLWGQLYFIAKEKKQVATGRIFTEDMSRAWVEKHPKYIKAQLACINARDSADAIYACIKSFEQRKDLIQSISSNLRKEN
jgi:hypothetical protein